MIMIIPKNMFIITNQNIFSCQNKCQFKCQNILYKSFNSAIILIEGEYCKIILYKNRDF